MTEGTPATSADDGESQMSEAAAAAIAASRARREKNVAPTKPTVAAKGGRFLAAGAAVGLSLAAVGGMAAASQAGDQPAPAATIQRVVIPQQPTTPQQIVIVLSNLDGTMTSSTEIVVPIEPQSVEITAPAKPTPPKAQAKAPAPVAESGGS
jgi:hypothetical protein